MTPRVKAAGITPHIRESSWSQLQDARTASAGPKARRAQAHAPKQHPKGPRSARARSGAWPPTAKACSLGEPTTGSGPRPLGAPAPTSSSGAYSPGPDCGRATTYRREPTRAPVAGLTANGEGGESARTATPTGGAPAVGGCPSARGAAGAVDP